MKKTKDSQEAKILRKPVARIETATDTGLTQAQVKNGKGLEQCSGGLSFQNDEGNYHK